MKIAGNSRLSSWVLSAVLSALISSHSYAQKTLDTPKVIWQEAEWSDQHNWSPGALVDIKTTETISGQEYMQLVDDGNSPGEARHYAITYNIKSATGGDYMLWVAASPQDEAGFNPLTVTINGDGGIPLNNKKYASGSYGDVKKFGWIKAGSIKLRKGNNVIQFEADSKENSRQFTVRLDAFFLTTDLAYVPQGPLPTVSPQPAIGKVLKNKSLQAVREQLEYQLYQRRIKLTEEDIGDATARDVIARLKKRHLPGKAFNNPGTHEFGVHGMEMPFVRKGIDDAKIALAYELLASAGVQSFRTAESCWHRLGDNYSDYKELDYQVKNASRYGMTHLFTVGYPSPKYAQSGMNLAAVSSEYIADYRKYLHQLISRYKDQGLRYVELGNEVDAPDVWWHNSTTRQYVQELKMLKEETDKLSNTIQTVGIAATYSRDTVLGGATGGRRFVDSCFAQGMDQYADTYSLHYTWPLSEKNFVDYFKAKVSGKKQLINTEESAYGKPSDIIKLFTRDFFLYNFKRVDYYLARDWFEAGNMLYCGLFDLNWRPKKRLLAYAASVDAIKGRELVGISRPAENTEAYVLQKKGKATGAKYAIVIWQNSESVKESLEPQAFDHKPVMPVAVKGFKGKLTVEKWNLDLITYKQSPSALKITDEPLIIYTDALPNWKLMTPEGFFKTIKADVNGQKGLMPGQ